MNTRIPSTFSMMQLATACAIVGLPTATLGSEAFLARDFTSIRLSEIQSSTIATSEHVRLAQLAAVGPVEKIDLVANRIVVAGQSVDMTGLSIDDYKLGDLVSLSGLISTSGISEPTIELLPDPYIYGATLSYIEGFVTKSDPSTATATIGGSTIDFSMALSKSLGSATDVGENSYVRVVGIQVLNGLFVGADLQVIPLDATRSRTKNGPTAAAPKAIIGGDRSAKAILGGDRSVKAIIGGDRSAKAILGGDRSSKAIIGGDRSAKVILGGDRSAKAIIGGDRSAKAILGGDRSSKAIIGGDRNAKAILGGDRSSKAIIGGDRSAKAILGGNRSAKAADGGNGGAK